jgi:aminoglycoside 6-adenylyltransferase
MQGSRTNPTAPADIFHDYDICYYVNNIASFRNDPNWIDIFGERLMLLMPDPGKEEIMIY